MARRREAYLRYQSRQPREERRQAPIPTELWEEIAARMTQQDTPIYDERGNRWVQCERCKKIDTDDKFAFYGGVSHMNLGVCNDCIEKG